MLAVGAGAPVTVVGHGLGASYDETRPLVGGLPGTRVLHRFRGHGEGHGDAPLGDGPVSWQVLGRDLLSTADEVGATRALGVSLGAGALLALLAEQPDRFERVVLFLPAALDQARPVERALALADALETGSEGAVLPLVLDELPLEQRETRAGASYARNRTAFLLGSAGLPGLVRGLAGTAPVADRAVLGGVSADVLVVAQEGDPVHPADVAREVAAALPRARLVVFDRPGVVWHSRARLREELQGFLAV